MRKGKTNVKNVDKFVEKIVEYLLISGITFLEQFP